MKYNKVISVCCAYCKWEVFEAHWRMAHDRYTEGIIEEKWCILAHYPQENNIEQIKRMCAEYKISVFDSGYNRGHVGNLNHFIAETKQPKKTLMIKIDPDLMPPLGFDKPMVDVAEADRSLAVVSLWNSTLPPIELSDHLCVLANCAVAIYDTCKLGAIYAVDIDFIREAGGFKEAYKNWGGTEGNLYKDVVRLNRKWGYIMDVKEEYPPEIPLLLDMSYQMWKFYLQTQKFKESYEDYIKLGCPKL